jgi:lipoprotein-anchoring transpeptidase ErfK/SrfK
VRRVGLFASFLCACAAAGALAALAAADGGPGGTTTGTGADTTLTGTGGTETAPQEAGTTPTATTTTPEAALPEGVTLGGVAVGGLSVPDATAAVEQAFAQPVVLRYGHTTLRVSPGRLGATAAVDRVLVRAQAAPAGSVLALPVTVTRARVASYLEQVAKRFDRKPVDSRLVLRHLRPLITKARVGHRLDVRGSTAAIVRTLTGNSRGPIVLRTQTLRPKTTPASFSSVIVIRRGSNALNLYRRTRPWRSFRVATGQSQYPTPLGRFQIVVMWKNPWWYPPDSPWAQGEKPVPPGPGNPLGTRWMGISSPGVGIHGTPDDGSIGYSLSHGCIRMHIPDAEWLFSHVHVGTPVFIVSA